MVGKMNHKLDEIRKNIAKRKINRGIKPQQRSYSYGSILDDEERFGYPSDPKTEGKLDLSRTSLFPKFLISLFIFFITFFIYNSQFALFTQMKPHAQQILTEDLPFATVQAWYEERFSSPLVLLGRDARSVDNDVNQSSIPVSGLDEAQIKDYQDGVHIEVLEAKNVYPMTRGTVLFAGRKQDTGNTIIIQHEDGQKSVYGHLSTIDVFHYQFVRPNQIIATVEPDEVTGFTNMYFAIQDNDKFINPMNFILGDQYEE